MGLDVMIDPVIAEKIEVKSLFPFFGTPGNINLTDIGREIKIETNSRILGDLRAERRLSG